MDQWSAIQAKAAETLAEYERRARRPAFTETSGSHALLEDLAQRCRRLTVADDPDLPPNIQGQLSLDESEGTIRVNASLNEASRAFVIGHEIGHAVLKHPPREIWDGPEHIDEVPHTGVLSAQNGVYQAYSERDRWELEANVFAAELLAPVRLVRERVLADGGWTVSGLADYFGLSRAAMLGRLAAALLPGPTLGAESSPTATPPMDESQGAAATALPPALILAGPGAGKTRVLVERYTHLVRHGTDPRRILALTFANRAAEEMRERLVAALPESAHLIRVSTFHSLGLELLQAYGYALGIQTPQLLTPADVFVLIRSKLNTLDLGRYEDLHQPTRHLRDLLDAVSRAKDELVTPIHFRELAEAWQSELAARSQPQDEPGARELAAQREAAGAATDVAAFYAQHKACLYEGGFLDYGDLVAESVRLFDDPDIGGAVRGRYDHILVDEFQDINYASGRLVWSLDGGRGVVWAVGDPRQSIYRFRGASPANLSNFTADYPGAKVMALEVNYRSVEGIVRAGHAVPVPLPTGGTPLAVPDLQSHRGRPSPEPSLEVAVAATEAGELRYLVERVRELTPTSGLRDIVVLCRTRAHAQKVSDALESAAIANDWSGALEERALFKDVMGVLLLAVDNLHGLVRLARMPEHHLSEEDLRSILKSARDHDCSLRAALRLAAAGKISGLSAGGTSRARRLRHLGVLLRRARTPWRVLAAYLFEYASWPRALVGQTSTAALRALSTLGQLADLARNFAHRSAIAGGTGTRAFIDFLRSSLEAGALEAPEVTRSALDCVRVMTVHRSKGLEWPVVLVPNMADGRFPAQDREPSVPLPPGLIRGAGADDVQGEEACLFYVAVTRARDHLVLTRAEKYGRLRQAPSPFLDGLISQLELDGHLRQIAADVGGGDGETGPPLPQDASPPAAGLAFDGPVPLRVIRAHDQCGLRVKYEELYGLGDEDRGYQCFHRATQYVLELAARQAAAGEKPSQDAMAQMLDEKWQELGLAGHWFAAKYRRFAERLVHAFAERLGAASSIEVRQEVIVSVGGRAVSLKVDEVVTTAGTVAWRRQKLGRPAASHRNDDVFALLALAGQQEEGRTGVRAPVIRLHYPLAGQEEDVAPTARVIKNRSEKAAAVIAAMEAGEFPAKPGRHCQTCPHTLVCPA